MKSKKADKKSGLMCELLETQTELRKTQAAYDILRQDTTIRVSSMQAEIAQLKARTPATVEKLVVPQSLVYALESIKLLTEALVKAQTDVE